MRRAVHASKILNPCGDSSRAVQVASGVLVVRATGPIEREVDHRTQEQGSGAHRSDVEDGIREDFPEVRRVYIEAQSTARHREALVDIGEDADALDRDDNGEVEGETPPSSSR